MKIPVEFEACFESDSVVPIHIGRISIGPHIMRLHFYPDGTVKGVISETAKTDGSLLFVAPHGELLGFVNESEEAPK